jgi:predicted AlkP superfamily phosphohydrolase/phosphomutase
VTGRGPGQHGVFDFVRVEQHGEHPNFRLATSSDIQCPTLWSRLGEAGRRVIALNFPVMYPPRPVNGFLIPGFVPRRHLKGAMFPADLYSRLKGVPGIEVAELAVDFEDERRSVQVLAPERHEEWIRFHIRRERQWYGVMRHLMETETWDLAAVLFDGVDKLQHACWRFIEERAFAARPATAWERTVRELCLDYFRQLDDLIAGLIEAAGSDTRVFFASDHGFTGSDEIFYVNSWLAQQGDLAWRADAPFAEEGYINTEGMKAAAYLFDWNGTRAFSLTPGSNGIYLRLNGGPASADPAARAALARRIADGLLQVVNPATGAPVVQRVLPREEAFPGPASHLAADLTLVLRDFGFVSVVRSHDIVRPRKELAGTHHPHGIFLAAGPGVRRGAAVERLTLLDMAPALLHSLGLPVPAELEGRVPEAIYEPDHLAGQPVRVADVAGAPAAPEGGDPSGMDAEGEAAIMERLRSLGYVE